MAGTMRWVFGGDVGMMYITSPVCSSGKAVKFRGSPRVPLLTAARDSPCSALLIPNGTVKDWE